MVRPLVLALLSAFYVHSALAEKPAPKIGLVLEGGGALGFAHVGVLKVLEEERIPVHYIAGTSMGSIVGAAYASGRTIGELEEILSTTDWDKLFDESPARRNVMYRHKAGREQELFGNAKIGIVKGSVSVPTAVVQGEFIELLCHRLFGKADAFSKFDDLPIPFRAVAADLATGETVVIDKGSLALAARASMSVPGFFTPVEIDGRMLVDGGVTNNFPVDVAFDMGADLLVAVQFKTKLREKTALTNPVVISAQILDLLLTQTSKSGLASLRPQDVLIQPDISAYSSTSFKEAKAIMKAGEDAARALVPRLRALAIPANDYSSFAQHRTAHPEFAPVVSFVDVQGVRPYRAGRLEQSLAAQVEKPLDREMIEEVIRDEYKGGEYEKIVYDVTTRADGKKGVVIKAQERGWFKNYVRMGFALEDNFDGTSFYSAAFNTRLNDVNSLGAYADLQLEVGRNPRVFTELYQPLSLSGLFFIAPEFTIGRQQLTLSQGGENLARYYRQTGWAAFKGGISFGEYGEALVGIRRGTGELLRDIGDPSLPEVDFEMGDVFARINIDQLDNPDFPTEGYRLSVSGNAARDALGSSDNFEQSRALASVPLTYGDTTLLLNAESGLSSDDTPAEYLYGLGGLFDVSGYKQGTLAAHSYWVARAMVYHRFLQGASALIPFGGFVGASFEQASLRSDLALVGDRPQLSAGSLFIGLDTPLLPVYLAVGFSDESEQAIYLNLGRLTARRRQ